MSFSYLLSISLAYVGLSYAVGWICFYARRQDSWSKIAVLSGAIVFLICLLVAVGAIAASAVSGVFYHHRGATVSYFLVIVVIGVVAFYKGVSSKNLEEPR